jgi:hypothetical protein
MTHITNKTPRQRTPSIRHGIAAGALVAALSLSGAAVAIADNGGIGSGSGGGGGDSDGGGDRGDGKYEREWQSFSRKDKRWAKSTSECESGGDPRVHGSGGLYHGAFQFHADTWRTSPMSPGGKHADRFSWTTQAVVAVKLMKRDGKGHWPVCG